MKSHFKIWLETRDYEFYLALIEERWMPSWLKNVFLAGSMALAPILMSGESTAGEFQTKPIVKELNDKKGKITIEVKIPIKLSRFDLASENVKSSIKNELSKFLQSQEREKLESGKEFLINLRPEVFVDFEGRSDINPVFTKFDLRELLPNWKNVDQTKLERLFNNFIKSTEEEKKKGFHILKFNIYYDKIQKNQLDKTLKNPEKMQKKQSISGSKSNPTQSNIVK